MRACKTERSAPKLSVIIPVYNVEPYLRSCMDSLLSVQSGEIEYICVAGRSQDCSTNILLEYAGRDKRVSIIEQRDTGLSEARNLGVKQAMGEYLLFADSDDFVRPALFQVLFDTLKERPQEDIFITDFSMVTVRNGVIREKPIYQINAQNDGTEGLDFLPQMLKRKQCFWNVWRYVYRRSFLERNGIAFRCGSMCEDVDFTNQVLMANPKTLFLHCPFYCYRVAREDSQMGHATSRRIRDTIAVLRDSIRSLDQSDFKWKQELIAQYQFELILTMAQLYEIPTDEREMIKHEFQKALPALNLGCDRFAKIAYRICSIAGVKPMARCLFGAKRLKQRHRAAWRITEEAIC